MTTEEHYTQKGLDIHNSIEAVLNIFPYAIRFEEAMEGKAVTVAFEGGQFIHPKEQFIFAYSPIGFLENFIDKLNDVTSSSLAVHGPDTEILISHRGSPQFVDGMWFGYYTMCGIHKGAGSFVVDLQLASTSKLRKTK